MDMNVKISLCMIVKNEEDVIARCLDSVSRCVDEIIIADTGSSDRTKEICRDFTDKVFDFDWTDDFAAARNFSFSKATGDYLMWLDADDVVSSENIGLLKELKKTLAQKNPDVVMCRYVTSFDENGTPLFSFFRERLLKRTANFKWEGFIHECISPRGNIIYSDFTVHHNAAADAGTAKCFSCKDSFLISGLVLQPSSGRHEIYQFVNCFVLCGYRYIQSNAFLLQQFCNSHHLLPLFFIQLREQFHNFFPASDSMRKGSRSSAGRAKL